MADRKTYETAFQVNAELGGGYQATMSKAKNTMTALQEQVQKLKKTQSDVSGYEKTQKALESTEKKLENQKKSYEALSEEYSRSKRYSAQLADAMEDLARTISQTDGDTGELEARYESMSAELNKAAQYEARLQSQMLSKEQQITSTTHSVSSYEKRLDELGDSLTKAGIDTKNLAQEQDRLQKELDQTGDKLEKSAKKVKGLAGSEGYGALEDILGSLGLSLGSLTAAGITSGLVNAVQYMNDLVEETRELRTDLSKLEQNALDAGQEIDSLNEHLTDMVAITGESDSSIEALSNLMAAGYTGNGLEEAVELLSAAVIKFPDTLKIESLADSLQESIATGSATGQFEELLGRLGVNTDDFANNLAECTTNAEKQNYALKVLSSTGLSETLDMYKQNNEELLEYNGLAFESEQASARLAEAWQETANDMQRLKISFYEMLTDGLLVGEQMQEQSDAITEDAWDKMGSFGSGIKMLIKHFRGTGDAAGEAVKTVEEMAVAEERAAISTEGETRTIRDHTAAYESLASVYESRTHDINRSVETAREHLQDLRDAYDEAKAAALESVQGQWRSWETIEYTTTESAATITNALNSQTTYWSTYATNLEMLRGRNIKGLQELVDTMADGSEDSATYIAAMAWATDDELEAMVSAYDSMKESQERASEDIALAGEDFRTEIDETQQRLDDFAAALDQEDAAYQAAVNTMKGFAWGIQDSTDIVAGAYASALQAAADSMATSQPTQDVWYGPGGYATGTDSASPGWALVGEKGPELVHFGGGEMVLDAEETSNALGTTMVQLSPSYQITMSGTADTAALQQTMAAQNDALRQMVESVLDQIQQRRRRGAYA